MSHRGDPCNIGPGEPGTRCHQRDHVQPAGTDLDTSVTPNIMRKSASLYNTSDTPANFGGWQFGDATDHHWASNFQPPPRSNPIRRSSSPAKPPGSTRIRAPATVTITSLPSTIANCAPAFRQCCFRPALARRLTETFHGPLVFCRRFDNVVHDSPCPPKWTGTGSFCRVFGAKCACPLLGRPFCQGAR